MLSTLQEIEERESDLTIDMQMLRKDLVSKMIQFVVYNEKEPWETSCAVLASGGLIKNDSVEGETIQKKRTRGIE
jgi:hypothetical protein